MVDAMVSNTIGSNTVWVQVPFPAPLKNLVELLFNLLININSRNGIDFLLHEKKEMIYW